MLKGYLLEDRAKKYGKRLAAMANPHRLAVLHLLADKPMELHELVSYLNIPQALTAHHVGVLYRAGWLEKEKTGRAVRYSIRRLAFGWFERFFADTAMKRR